MATVDDLTARRAVQYTRLEGVIDELISVIASDITPFLQREVRAIFVASGAFSETLDDAALRGIKQKIEAHGTTLAGTFKDRLANVELWVGSAVPSAEGKTLQPNESVWTALQELATATTAFAESLGFPVPEGGWDVTYRTPTWFIEGHYAPGLIEKYWTQLAVLRDLEGQIEVAETEERKERLADRWDALS